MKILAIDTSSKNAAVAILENQNTIIELNNDDEKTHSQKLMPMIDEAFIKSNMSLDDINLISCCLGPGSFTGVRIGIATAKAFSDSKNIPTFGVSSLEALAHNLNQDGLICGLINANNGNVYAGIFEIVQNQTIKSKLSFLSLKDSNGNISLNPLKTFIESDDELFNKYSNISFIGDGAILYKELFKQLIFKKPYTIEVCEENISTGISIGKIGYTNYKNGNYGDSSFLSPIYLRKSQAELALEEKNGIKND